jgi:hypothetical protein
MAVLKPQITSVIQGLITITVLSPTVVGAAFDQLLIYRAGSANGSFSLISTQSLTGAESYTYLDSICDPSYYYKAQYFNSSTMIMSQFSELAQETGIFSPYTVPETTASYPPEIALATNDREIVESIRVTLGDMGSIERDYYNSSDPQSAFSCASQISSDQCTWELLEPRGWPQRVVLNGDEKTNIQDPQVIGYKFLTFSGGTACITGSLDVFYNHFRFADREVLMAYDRSINLLVSCNLTTDQITTEMQIMQASILLLEGELRGFQSGNAVRVRDGDTEYDSTATIRSRTQDLEDLKRKLQELIDCVVWQTSYSLQGYRVE